MNHKSVYKKKFVSSCMAVCLAGYGCLERNEHSGMGCTGIGNSKR